MTPIVNATLLRIDTPGTPDALGRVAYTAGSAIAVGICVDNPKESQHWSFGAVIKDAIAVMYVMRDDLAGAALTIGYRGSVQVEGEAAWTFEVVYKVVRVLDGMEHFECFLKAV